MSDRYIFIKLVLQHFCGCGNESCLLISSDVLSNNGSHNMRRCSKWGSNIGFFIVGDYECLYRHHRTEIACIMQDMEFSNPNFEIEICKDIISKVPELKQFYKADMGALARISVS